MQRSNWMAATRSCLARVAWPGDHHFLVAGKLKPQPATAGRRGDQRADATRWKAHVVKDDLLHRYLARSEDHCTHTGGGSDASALLNGTTRNGSGGGETVDDGKTFRGYGRGDWLTLHLKQPCDLSEIRTFAGHSDARASQNYAVLVADSGQPERFVKLASGSKRAGGGASELRLPVKARERRGGPFRVPRRAAWGSTSIGKSTLSGRRQNSRVGRVQRVPPSQRLS